MEEKKSPFEWHGRLGEGQGWTNPVLTADCKDLSRPEYTKVQAHEYRDTEEVLREKVTRLAVLVRQARFCVAYTGAGLSAASGLDDYATKAKETLSSRPHVGPERGSGYLALPNTGHETLVRMQRAGMLKRVVNQNHDGLLQKAGYPQHALNEIHGAWFDPANPGGNILRDDLFEDLLVCERSTDLCLALGTSLSGLNADRLATTPAQKYLQNQRGGGLVIVALQATRLDDMCTLRIFAPLDDVLGILAEELVLPPLPEPIVPEDGDVFRMPYDPLTGKPTVDGSTHVLDLSTGARIQVLMGNFAGCKGVVVGKNSQGHYELQIIQPVEGMEGVSITDDHLLGSWWLQEAEQGLLSCWAISQD